MSGEYVRGISRVLVLLQCTLLSDSTANFIDVLPYLQICFCSMVLHMIFCTVTLGCIPVLVFTVIVSNALFLRMCQINRAFTKTQILASVQTCRFFL